MNKSISLLAGSYLSKKKICIYAFIVRIIALVCILVFSPQLSTGFSGSTSIQDDVRIIEGAEIYARTAKSVIDVPALESAYDQVELAYHDASVMELDYWLFSIGLYLLGNVALLRLLNILFAVASVFCLYEIANLMYGRRVAEISSLLYALLPYPVFFSCFLYKDQLYTLVFLLIIRRALKCVNRVKISDYIFLAITLFLSMWIRSGLVVLVLFATVVIIFKRSSFKFNFFKVALFAILAGLVLGYIAYLSWDKIMLKFTRYVVEYETEGGGIVDYFTIKSPAEIYRYPFSFLFLLIIPINYVLKVATWYDLVGVLNIIAIPVAIGNFFYLFNFKIKKDYFYWLMQVFYFVAICTSLTIPRHQFFLQPLTMLFFANYYCNLKNKLIWKASSVSVSMLICLLMIFNI